MKSDPRAIDPEIPGDPEMLINGLAESLRETTAEVVPWFLENMPPVYFQDTDEKSRLIHLRSIIAAKASGQPLVLNFRSEDDSEWTFMRPVNQPGVLADLLRELPEDRPLQAAKIHTARDNDLILVTFVFGEGTPFSPSDPEQALKLEQTVEYAREHLPGWSPEEVAMHFTRCTQEQLATLTPIRLAKQYEVFNHVTGTEDVSVTLDSEENTDESRIVFASPNVNTCIILERIARRLAHARIGINRAYLDTVDDGANGRVNVMGFVVQGPDGRALDRRSELWKSVRRDLRRIKWLDSATLDLSYRYENLTFTRADMTVALCHLVHQVLVKEDPHAFGRDRIIKLATRNIDLMLEIAALFLERFNPDDPLDDTGFEARVAKIRGEIEKEVDLEDARTVLDKILDAIVSVLRTNIFLESRYATSFRLKPEFFGDETRAELLFGVFFIHGRSFDGFHVRFRDIARGGIRAIRTKALDQHARESERLFDEAYGLSFAQQLKNKDIPEGGAKAALLLEPGTPVDRCVKAFVDSLLDLITPDEETQRKIVDHLGSQEFLYLGPDENITPKLIEWTVERARRRGYPAWSAIMSSKPGAGINHKTYGVTSEGVAVYLDVVLRTVGIDPTSDKFSVKITGGPDGDVAGNMINILARDYGENVKIVGIADGSGSGEDPDGLDMEELLRLFRAELPIAEFDRSKLGSGGRVVTIEEPDGAHLRNTLHNRVTADAFIPAGGRPATIHKGNWREYLDDAGKPTSRVIVEGANLFLTPEARSELTGRGVLIVKDSSANKCGVICSSFEIVACMLLDEAEFMNIKEVFVEQVLVKLRFLARREAELLMRAYRHHPTVPLPEISIRLSRVMIRTADAIETALDGLEKADEHMVRMLVIQHLPGVLVETAGDRIWEKTPPTYLRWIMAKSLAARIVYREGLEYLEAVETQAIAHLTSRYLKLESERAGLVVEVLGSGLPRRERIADLLATGGIIATMGELPQAQPTSELPDEDEEEGH